MFQQNLSFYDKKKSYFSFSAKKNVSKKKKKKQIIETALHKQKETKYLTAPKFMSFTSATNLKLHR